MPRKIMIFLLAWACLGLLAACAAPVTAPAAPSAAAAAEPVLPLTVTLLYPKPDTVVEMGKQLKCIVQINDAAGAPVNDAAVTLTLVDPGGSAQARIGAVAGAANAYRSEAWPIPHRLRAGTWEVQVRASRGDQVWETSGSFDVKNSTSEELLQRYGFWLDAPTLKGIEPFIGAERGDAANGLIRWGGIIPAQHIFPENWVEVQWRSGNFQLDSSEAVQRFLLEELGDLGFTPLRLIGDFVPAKFKGWDAWQGKPRGELERYDMEWVVFYAPEADKTYAIATTVVLPPVGIDPHAALRDGFEVHPEVQAQGVAPEPLLDLEPAPRLLSPALGARFEGLDQPVILEWEAVKELAADEYYELVVDYNYRETNFKHRVYTRETQATLPEELYRQPNCSVYNWRVTLKRKTGEAEDGRWLGDPLTYPSLYGYVHWVYPLDEKPPFPHFCPNAQY